MLSRFKIVFRKEKWYAKRATSIVYGNSYFISDKDSTGYTRFVIVEYGEGKEKIHKFACNANDFLYVQLDLINKEDES